MFMLLLLLTTVYRITGEETECPECENIQNNHVHVIAIMHY